MSIQQDVIDTALVPVVHRWQRYGFDRAYVAVDGVAVGYRDLRTGRIRCDEPAYADLIDNATVDLLAELADLGELDGFRGGSADDEPDEGRDFGFVPEPPATRSRSADEYVPRHAASDGRAHRNPITAWALRKRAV